MKAHFSLCRASVVAWAGFVLLFPTKGTDSASGLSITPTNSGQQVETTKPGNAPTPVQSESQNIVTDKALSWQSREIVKLHQSGADPAVIKTYVEHMPTATPPTADEIIALRNHGVGPDVISAYIKRTHQLQAQASAAPPQGTASNVTPSGPVVNAQPAPIYLYSAPQQSPVVYSTYASPSYVYVTPPNYYYAPYYTYPGLSSRWYHKYYPRHYPRYYPSPAVRSYYHPRVGYYWYDSGRYPYRNYDYGGYHNRPSYRPPVSYAGTYRSRSAWTPYQGGGAQGGVYGNRGHGGGRR